jgi:hypothetical protein
MTAIIAVFGCTEEIRAALVAELKSPKCQKFGVTDGTVVISHDELPTDHSLIKKHVKYVFMMNELVYRQFGGDEDSRAMNCFLLPGGVLIWSKTSEGDCWEMGEFNIKKQDKYTRHTVLVIGADTPRRSRWIEIIGRASRMAVNIKSGSASLIQKPNIIRVAADTKLDAKIVPVFDEIHFLDAAAYASAVGILPPVPITSTVFDWGTHVQVWSRDSAEDSSNGWAVAISS